jgi:Flp pilus assembly protein TadG
MGGMNSILALGGIILGLGTSVLAIDLPYYFAAQNQLQTATDAAALAGAMALPDGEQQAEDAALEVATKNPIAGKALQASDLKYTSNGSTFEVTTSAHVPTVMAKVLCSITGGAAGRGQDGVIRDSNGASVDTDGCSYMTVYAHSKAIPAARDTILVIDTSSSMDDLGYNRPFKDVKSAAKYYIDMVANLQSESTDRIGLVSFDQTGKLQQTLVSQHDSPSFSVVKTKVDGLKLFSGTGWNTNYEAGLRIALDEMQSHGRKNAEKIVIFLTDGMPNLPAPSNYYSYSQYQPYTKCTDMVDNSAAVKAKCTYKNGQKICPVLPSSQITDSMISSAAVSCGQTYVSTMQGLTNTQTDRAKSMDVTIHTVSIHDSVGTQSSEAILRRLLKDPYWEPNQLDYMATTTKGEQYEAENYDAAKMQDIYKTIAEDIHIRLGN